MKNLRVCLSSYSLKSHNGSVNWFKSWVIEGSNDEESWTTLDERNTDELVGQSIVKTYDVKSTEEYFRYIRMRLTGPTSNGYCLLILTNIELFGSVVE